MSEPTLAEILADIDPDDDAALARLARVIDDLARTETREAVEILRAAGRDARAFRRAAILVQALGDLAVKPLLAQPAEPDRDQLAWDLGAAVKAAIAGREKVSAALERALDDRRPLTPPSSVTMIDEMPAPRRVCDEAYALLRRLLSSDESEYDLHLHVAAFRNMSDEGKDAEIARWKRSRRWVPLLLEA